MGLESAVFLSGLVQANPLGTDQKAQGDDHIRLIKNVLQATFPNATKAFYFPSGHAVTAADVTVTTVQNNRAFPIDATSVGRTVTLPSASVPDGFVCAVIKTDVADNPVVVTAAALINGVEDLYLRQQWDSALLRYNSTSGTWYAEVNAYRYGVPRSVSTNTALTIVDLIGMVTVDATGAARTVTLPDTVPAGFTTKVKKIDSSENVVTLDATAGGLINGAATFALTLQYAEAELFFNGSTWFTSPSASGEVGVILEAALLLKNLNIVQFTSNGTYTPHDDMQFALIFVTGAGAGGGGVDGTDATGSGGGGGGGGAGATVMALQTRAELLPTQAVTIGAAGIAGTDVGGDGGNGGDTILGSLITAKGGLGGKGLSTGIIAGALGGLGGSASGSSGGFHKAQGEPGGSGLGISVTNIDAHGGRGGNTLWGGGALAAYLAGVLGAQAAGNPGIGRGSGGGGAVFLNTTTGAAGGVGIAGYIVIVEFLSYAAS